MLNLDRTKIPARNHKFLDDFDAEQKEFFDLFGAFVSLEAAGKSTGHHPILQSMGELERLAKKDLADNPEIADAHDSGIWENAQDGNGYRIMKVVMECCRDKDAFTDFLWQAIWIQYSQRRDLLVDHDADDEDRDIYLSADYFIQFHYAIQAECFCDVDQDVIDETLVWIVHMIFSFRKELNKKVEKKKKKKKPDLKLVETAPCA